LKLLLDQNLSRKLVPHLASVYPGSSHVFLLGLAKSDDSDIWYYAKHHGFVLVTKNTDMVDLCVLRGAPPKILWLRTGNCATDLVRQVLANNHERIRRFKTDSTVALSLFPLIPVD
jgi:predicted nuclease of predicted toxin-antitoxin system